MDRAWTKTLCATTAIGLVTAAAMTPARADSNSIVSVDFTATPAPTSDADILTTQTTSKAVVRYADGSTKEFPLSYNVLFKNVDKVGSNVGEAARLYDVEGEPLSDLNGDPVIAETPDSNSLLDVDGKLFLVTHYEYDWLLGDGQSANKAEGWYSRMPMSMTVTDIEQDAAAGALKAVDQRPVDFSSVHGLWIPCFGSQTPWNTHLGSEEDYDLYYTAASGEKGLKLATSGLKALNEVYFKGTQEANPYNYGYITEVVVKGDGSSTPIKHYSMGRGTWEAALVMPDQRTAYFGDDGDHVGTYMYVADTPGNIAAGTLYAARWNQVRSDNGGAADLRWIKLGHASDDEIRGIIDSGITFEDIFDYTTAEQNANWEVDGFRMIRAGHSGDEVLKLKSGMETAAAFLEPRRYAAYLGATTEFNKMEGVALDPKAKHLYLALSYIEKGFQREEGAPADHIQIDKVTAGGVYQVALNDGQVDSEGNAIDSEWVGTAMRVPASLLGEDIEPDALGNIANPEKIANPDNIFFSNKMRTLFVGEDSGTHVNNFLWAYNVDTGKLTRILSVASGAESTGLQVVENINGHAYIMSNNQHQGEWLKSLPEDVKARFIETAEATYGANDKGVLNYNLEANVGYIGGIPGL
jgi:secreted PhoX family phosphatase